MSQRSLGPDLRQALVAMVRRRVPEADVEDIVQTALTEALQSPHAPTEPDALRKWVFGVAKNKVIDFHRRARRESFDVPEVSDGPAPHDEADLLRWAERELPPGSDARRTLGWMLREGEGEKLEQIAETENVPAPRVRQRVSRLRRHFKTRWAAEVAVLAALGVAISALVLWYLRGNPDKPEPITRDVPSATAPSITPPPPSAVPELRPAGSIDGAAPAPPPVTSDRATPPAPPAPSGSFAPAPAPVDMKKLDVKPRPAPTELAPKPAPNFAPKSSFTPAPSSTEPAPAFTAEPRNEIPQGKVTKPMGDGSWGGSKKGGGKPAPQNLKK
jgi:RNA polymerase sigma factor (sigma-70 family)